MNLLQVRIDQCSVNGDTTDIVRVLLIRIIPPLFLRPFYLAVIGSIVIIVSVDQYKGYFLFNSIGRGAHQIFC